MTRDAGQPLAPVPKAQAEGSAVGAGPSGDQLDLAATIFDVLGRRRGLRLSRGFWRAGIALSAAGNTEVADALDEFQRAIEPGIEQIAAKIATLPRSARRKLRTMSEDEARLLMMVGSVPHASSRPPPPS